MTSVLQDWVMELPLREQGTILAGIRGCDTAPKTPGRYDTPERNLTAHLRFCTMIPADARELAFDGGFLLPKLPPFKQSELGHYPMHWYSHTMHAYEVVGYRHPDVLLAHGAIDVYLELVHGLHLWPEMEREMVKRLSEDRIARGASDYRVDMGTPEEHEQLAEVLQASPATVLLSGYPSPLYDSLYADWWSMDIVVTVYSSNSNVNGRGGRTERLWSNRDLFSGGLEVPA